MKILFVTNGHGEAAIAARIARSLGIVGSFACDHLRLVGTQNDDAVMRAVGPAREMPSGGLIAMGNVRNLMRDLRAGLAGLTRRQWSFLRSARGTYDAAVAVGDAFALAMTLQTCAPAVFVGTAKSAYFAPYGIFERRLMRKARAVFVRDEATVQQLRAHGIAAQAANVMADLLDGAQVLAAQTRAQELIAILPGSRGTAYENARFLLSVVRAVAENFPGLFAMVSLAPGLQPERFAQVLRLDGWTLEAQRNSDQPFALFSGGRELARAWTGPIGSIVAGATLVLGQAGSANEAAAANGIPVVAFSAPGARGDWYRSRQAALLGGALLIAPRDLSAASIEVAQLLRDPARLQRMSQIGRERLGPPGAARLIADRIARLCA